MRVDDRTAKTAADVHLTLISDSEWRVSDARVSWDSPFSLIGFISLSGGKYEVLEFGDPMRTFFVASLAEAESKFVTRAGILPAPDQRRLDERLERILPMWAREQLSRSRGRG